MIEELAKQWVEAKAREHQANIERVEIERRIIAVTGAKQDGSKTIDAGPYKVTLTGKLIYKADIPMLTNLVENVPVQLRPLKTEVQLDVAGAKYLQQNEPAIWQQLAPAVTITSAKTAITIKEA